MHFILVKHVLDRVVELKAHINAISGAKSTNEFVFPEDSS